jgi:hypothetical protein
LKKTAFDSNDTEITASPAQINDRPSTSSNNSGSRRLSLDIPIGGIKIGKKRESGDQGLFDSSITLGRSTTTGGSPKVLSKLFGRSRRKKEQLEAERGRQVADRGTLSPAGADDAEADYTPDSANSDWNGSGRDAIRSSARAAATEAKDRKPLRAMAGAETSPARGNSKDNVDDSASSLLTYDSDTGS